MWKQSDHNCSYDLRPGETKRLLLYIYSSIINIIRYPSFIILDCKIRTNSIWSIATIISSIIESWWYKSILYGCNTMYHNPPFVVDLCKTANNNYDNLQIKLCSWYLLQRWQFARQSCIAVEKNLIWKLAVSSYNVGSIF